MGAGALDIVFPEAPIERDGFREALEHFGGGLFESTGPHRLVSGQSFLYLWLFPEEGGEGAVGSVFEWEELFCLGEFEFRKLGERALNDGGVLFGFDGARAVDEGSAGFEEGDCAPDECELLDGHTNEVFGSDSPADIDASPEHAGIRARHIEQNPIKGRFEERAFRFWGHEKIEFMHASDGGTEPREILAKPQGSRLEEFCGNDSSAVLHFFGEVRRFAAGGCASVKDAFTRLRVKEIACEEGARVLDVNEALL